MNQLIPFDTSRGGSEKNLCLNNVSRGYGINTSAYASAWEAWQNSIQHTDRNFPTGVAVPIYYSYTVDLGDGPQNYGHINVLLPDGRVWSDGNYYPGVEGYTANHAPKFVGWGESIGTIKIVEGDNMPTAASKEFVKAAYQIILGRDASEVSDAEVNSRVGQEVSALFFELADSKERHDLNNTVITAFYKGALQREPKQEETQAWLQRGLRNQAIGITGSEEAKAVTAKLAAAEGSDFVPYSGESLFTKKK